MTVEGRRSELSITPDRNKPEVGNSFNLLCYGAFWSGDWVSDQGADGARLFWLSDEAWAKIDPHLPHGKPGKPRVDDRRVLSGILHLLKTGCRWRDVPPEYGPATTVYNRYNRWSQRGIWQRLFEKLAASGEMPAELMLDSTYVKAHRSAAGANVWPAPLASGLCRLF